MQLHPAVQQACTFALAHASKTDDPTHEHTHVERMLTLFSQSVQQTQLSLDSLNTDPNVLLLSICFHDAGKAALGKAPSTLHQLSYNALDGISSAYLLMYYADDPARYFPGNQQQTAPIPENILTAAAHVIRLHSEKTPTLAPEALLLRIFDELELLELSRFQTGIEAFSDKQHHTLYFGLTAFEKMVTNVPIESLCANYYAMLADDEQKTAASPFIIHLLAEYHRRSDLLLRTITTQKKILLRTLIPALPQRLQDTLRFPPFLHQPRLS